MAGLTVRPPYTFYIKFVVYSFYNKMYILDIKNYFTHIIILFNMFIKINIELYYKHIIYYL